MNEFGKVLGVIEVWRYLMGAKPTKGSVFARETVRGYMKSGVIPAFMVRGQLCALRDDVDAFLLRIAREGDLSLDIMPVPPQHVPGFDGFGLRIAPHKVHCRASV